jgi:GNAT superfamily N-acetyltransferase
MGKNADTDAVVAMWTAMHAESPVYRDKALDVGKMRRMVWALVIGSGGALFVAEEDGKLVGVAAMMAGERWFGPERYATDLMVYVKPEYRGGRAFILLVRALESWAMDFGIEELTLGVSAGISDEVAVRAYQRLGYTLMPTRVLTKRLDDVHRV